MIHSKCAQILGQCIIAEIAEARKENTGYDWKCLMQVCERLSTEKENYRSEEGGRGNGIMIQKEAYKYQTKKKEKVQHVRLCN